MGNNGIGVVGVNWRVKMMALKFLDAGGWGSTAGAIKAINYAANKQVRITSNSWGGGGKSSALQEAISKSGALFVAAAGNSASRNFAYPAPQPGAAKAEGRITPRDRTDKTRAAPVRKPPTGIRVG